MSRLDSFVLIVGGDAADDEYDFVGEGDEQLDEGDELGMRRAHNFACLDNTC